MQIEMTPYGRYLYSIGKFMPHSYEFVDDDILYRASGSAEAQEDAHSRILSETPKTKINRAFQDEAPQVKTPPTIDKQRVMIRKNNMRQADIYPMGKSAYSGSYSPLLQVTMYQAQISGSQMTYTSNEINSHGNPSEGGELLIPQIDVNYNFIASLKDSLDPQDDYDGPTQRSSVFDDGTYLEIRYQEPILLLKEFNSFYEKENFTIEAFEISGSSGEEVLRPLKMNHNYNSVPSDIAIQEQGDIYYDLGFYEEDVPTKDFLEYFFEMFVDEEISQHVLCEVVGSLEVNSQFLDDELVCPDYRSDRFDIYGTRVRPSDLEDCD